MSKERKIMIQNAGKYRYLRKGEKGRVKVIIHVTPFSSVLPSPRAPTHPWISFHRRSTITFDLSSIDLT